MRRTPTTALLLATASLMPASAVYAQTGVSSAGNGGQAPTAVPNAPPTLPPQVTDANPSAAEVSAPAAAGVEEIIVTATRRSANLQSVPLSVTALQANTLAAQGIKTVADLPRMVPGLSTTRGSASTNIYLRGVG